MIRWDSAYRSVAGVSALGLALTALGCSHVSREDFDTEIAHVREEMQAGDEQTASQLNGRIDGVEERVAANERTLESLERDLRALERDFDVAIERLETALRFSTPVYFGFDDATIRPEDHEVLNRFCSVLQSYYPGSLVTVEGFTDQAGPEDYNLRLGQSRANAVKDHLVAEGCVDSDMIRAVSYGEDTDRLVMQGVTGPGPEGWENRRVVIVIDHGADAPGARPVVSD
jgi:outer membrane protein OmpA-like peptidoglycan-associated protein